MTLVRERDSEILAQFAIPIRGTWKNIAINDVPLDAVFDSLNIFIREGKVRTRPGLSLFSDTTFLEPIIGGSMVVTPGEKVILGITKDRIYQLSDITDLWTTIQPTGFDPTIADDDNKVIDMAFMETAGDYVALIASEGRVLKKWIDSPRSFATLTGTNIPRAKSVCIAGSRVIALIPPHTIVWSNVLNPAVFDTLAYAKRAQSGDRGVCVRTLSALSFVFYKERSIHIARAQAGVDEGTAFSFSEPLYVDGPAGIYSIVNVNGVHYYMTHNGRICAFDGTTYPRWIADGLWFFLQADIQPSQAHLIRSIYDYRLHTITFFYPKKDLGPGLRGMVLINLPFEGQDIQEIATTRAFLGTCQKAISHACEKRWDDQLTVDRSLMFTKQLDSGDRNEAFLLDESVTTDDGIPYQCSFQTGLQAMPDARHTHVCIETFLERGVGYGSILVEPVISDALETREGTIIDQSGQWIDLETNPIREYKGFGRQVRFFGLRYSWDSSNYVRYSGSVVYTSTPQKYRV